MKASLRSAWDWLSDPGPGRPQRQSRQPMRAFTLFITIVTALLLVAMLVAGLHAIGS